MYEYGKGLTQDSAAAASWYRKAADQGDALGQANLAQLEAKVATAQTRPPTPSTSSHRVQMVKKGGTYTVPVFINNVLSLNFVVDSGASDVTIPADVAMVLNRTGTIQPGDFIGSQKYQLADGSVIDSAQFIIRSLKVGDQTVENVRGSIGDTKGSLLLGQSFLEKFKSWSMDNSSHELVLE